MTEFTQSQEENPRSSKRKNLILIIAAVVALLVTIGVCVAVHFNHSKQETVSETKGDLSALHVFPKIDFVDSLYYKKVLVSYENESPRDVYYYEKDSLGQPTNKKVHETHYYPGEKKYIDGNVRNDARDGLWYAYHANGNVQTMAHYKNGKEDGRYVVYYENGNVYYTGIYKNGKRVGVWNFYDQDEKLVRTEDFDEKK